MRTKILTIMMTDIKGFTDKTARKTRSEMMAMLDKHEELILPVLESFGGRLVKTIGDAFLVTFLSATEAVLSGVAVQDKLDEYNRGKSEKDRIDIRIAINSGEVTVTDNDVFGESVNITARLESIAEAGEVFFTEAVYLAMNKQEVPSSEVGYRQFKGIPEQIKVYKVLKEKNMEQRALRVLMIEDNPDDALLIQVNLADLQTEEPLLPHVGLVHVEDLKEGLEALAGGGFDLVLLDLSLPDSEGLASVKTICRHAPRMPVVVLTGLADQELAQKALACGAQDYLLKGQVLGVLLVRSILYAIERNRLRLKLVKFDELKSSEERLRISQERYRLLFEESPVSLWEADFSAVKNRLDRILDSGLVDIGSYFRTHPETVSECAALVRSIDVNKATLELYGATGKDELKMSRSLFLADESYRVFGCALGSLAAGRTDFAGEAVTRTLAGEKRNISFELNVAPQHETTWGRVLVSVVDTTELKQLERTVLEISDREKQRIGRDLHDGLGQQITGMIYMAKALETSLTDGKTVELSGITRLAELGKQALDIARNLIEGLCPVDIDERGLITALDKLAALTEHTCGITCRFHSEEEILDLDRGMAIHLYRIAQEAVTNAVKHGCCKLIEIEMSVKQGQAHLSVRDDGMGFTPGEEQKGEGMGIRIMQYRAGMIDAFLDVNSEPGNGTVVGCSLPLS